MQILFLGTSCMFPTKERAQPCVLMIKNGSYLLFDCGEGAQRQLRIAGISPMKIHNIFITHWHGDHSLGIAGMIQSMAGNKRKTALNIYGPKGSKKRVACLLKAFDFKIEYELKVHELDLKLGECRPVLKAKDFTISAFRVKHGSATLAYVFKEADKRKINIEYTKKFGLVQHPVLGKLQKGLDVEYKGKLIKAKDATYIKKGKKIVYLTDTIYFKDLKNLIKDSDILICEATYMSDKEDKALEYEHLTAKQAGMLAKESNAKKLVLTHFSQRYENVQPLIKEAKSIFKNTIEAKDFLILELR